MKFRTSPVLYTFFIALFFTVVQNIALWRHLNVLFDAHPPNSVVFVLSIPIFICAALNIIFTLLIWPQSYRITMPVLILLSAFATYGMFRYGVFFDYGMIVNIFETNPGEAMSYLSLGAGMGILLIGILPAIGVASVSVSFPAIRHLLMGKAIAILVSLCVIGFIAAGYYKDYVSLVRNHSEIKALINPTNYLSATYRYARYQLIEADMPFTVIGTDAVDSHAVNVKAGEKPNVVVMVLGEASRAMNYSLNGYGRDTNPQLAQRNVISFHHVTSCGTATAASVPCMFSAMTQQTYDPIQARHQEGVLDVLDHAGIAVLWKDNDGGCKGACDRIEHIEMTADIDPSLCHNGSCYDQILLQGLQHYIDAAKQDTLIVLHLIGSHGPTYHDRYPDAFNVFTPTCDTSDLQQCTQQQVRNTYDNTIVYTDHILSQVIDTLKHDEAHANTALLYMADHGESLGEGGVYLHGLPYAIAPREQTSVPLILWLSPSYQHSQRINTACLAKAATTGRYSQDVLFHSLLGMMAVNSTVYDPQLDIFHSCRTMAQ